MRLNADSDEHKSVFCLVKKSVRPFVGMVIRRCVDMFVCSYVRMGVRRFVDADICPYVRMGIWAA